MKKWQNVSRDLMGSLLTSMEKDPRQNISVSLYSGSIKTITYLASICLSSNSLSSSLGGPAALLALFLKALQAGQPTSGSTRAIPSLLHGNSIPRLVGGGKGGALSSVGPDASLLLFPVADVNMLSCCGHLGPAYNRRPQDMFPNQVQDRR